MLFEGESLGLFFYNTFSIFQFYILHCYIHDTMKIIDRVMERKYLSVSMCIMFVVSSQ